MMILRDSLQKKGTTAWPACLYKKLAQVRVVVRATLREIFDENAYTRFLERHQLASSAKSYADFLREQDRARRLRCC